MSSPKNRLYGDAYMELYKDAPHRKNLPNATFIHETKSPACGDQVTFSGIITNGIISELSFQSTGSALSHIYAELLCQYAEKKPVEKILAITESDIKQILNLSLGASRFALILFITNGLKEGIAPYA